MIYLSSPPASLRVSGVSFTMYLWSVTPKYDGVPQTMCTKSMEVIRPDIQECKGVKYVSSVCWLKRHTLIHSHTHSTEEKQLVQHVLFQTDNSTLNKAEEKTITLPQILIHDSPKQLWQPYSPSPQPSQKKVSIIFKEKMYKENNF